MKDQHARDEIVSIKLWDKTKEKWFQDLRADFYELRKRHETLMAHLGLEWYVEVVNDGKRVEGIRNKSTQSK